MSQKSKSNGNGKGEIDLISPLCFAEWTAVLRTQAAYLMPSECM